MAEMGSYCKAYYAKDFRQFSDWQENIAELRPNSREENGQEIEEPRSELKDEDILYLQEDYVVTDGIMKDENIIFDQVTDEWKSFCAETLSFEIPVYEPIEIKVNEEPAEAGA